MKRKEIREKARAARLERSRLDKVTAKLETKKYPKVQKCAEKDCSNTFFLLRKLEVAKSELRCFSCGAKKFAR